MEFNLKKDQPIIKTLTLDNPISILLVEDNPGDVLIIKELLKSSGINYSLKNVTTVKETLVLCMEQQFDVLLLDLGLPDSLGLETLKKIQSPNMTIPVVVMTGLDDEEIALESLRAGAQDYLVKNRLTSDNILLSIKYSIERKKIQVLLKKNARQFSILSSTTAAFNECEDIVSVYNVICSSINKLLDSSGVIIIQLTGLKKIYCQRFEKLEPYCTQIKQITGIDIRKPGMHIKDLKPETEGLFKNEVLHKLVSESSFTIHGIGLIKSGTLYGGIIIIAQDDISDEDASIITTICNQASLSLHRRFMEKDLKSSENRYRNLSADLEKIVRKRTQDLEILNEQLKQELRERQIIEESLKESKLHLTELIATKDKFFNIIAHDLKNPFTCLLGSTEILNDNIQRMDKEKIRKLVQILNDSAKSGYAILENLLDWARTQTGLIIFNPEKINLKKLIDENIHNLQLSSTKKEINMFSELHEDLFIVADKNMINTVIRNLLSNAIKFTHNFGTVIVGVEVKGGEAIISVKDTGIGIPKASINKLFRIDAKFTRPGTDKEQGTGLGLKVSKEFIEMHGGKIYVKSTVNKGSEFIFSIPVSENSAVQK
jgi:signal transduction histidine kinase/DNA-binding NarL/FixJ family response regulator